MSLRRRPTTITEAKAFIARWHRHSEPPLSGFYAIGATDDGRTLRAVVIVGRPNARPLDDGWTAEATRLASDGSDNACSMLYSAAARAAEAMGYQSIITYTKADEPGTSLIAAGWEREEELPARPSWNCPSRQRTQTNLFGEDRRPPGPKVRWRKWLTKSKATRKLRPRLRGVDAQALLTLPAPSAGSLSESVPIPTPTPTPDERV